MRKVGTCSWYNKVYGDGILVDGTGNEYYVDSTELSNVNFLGTGEAVEFEVRDVNGIAMAYNVRSVAMPEDACEWCWERGEEVEADPEQDGLCEECAFDKSVGQADALMDRMRDGD